MKRNPNSKILIFESPILIYPYLAKTIGLNESIVLQEFLYELENSKYFFKDKKWLRITYKDIQKKFPFWDIKTIRRIILNLEKLGLINSTQEFNEHPMDKTKWYSVDEQELIEVLGLKKEGVTKQ